MIDRLLTDEGIKEALTKGMGIVAQPWQKKWGEIIFKKAEEEFQVVTQAQDAKTLKVVGESAVSIEVEDNYIWLKLPRGLIPEPIRLTLRGEMPGEARNNGMIKEVGSTPQEIPALEKLTLAVGNRQEALARFMEIIEHIIKLLRYDACIA